jgi:REP element-mobilizing transposase RayT
MTTHQQLFYHIVFSTKNRKRLLKDGFREEVFAYMAGICKSLDGFAFHIGGYYDHVHLLVNIPAKIAVSDFVGRLKANTSKHINETSKIFKFSWQDGFGAFTVSQSQKGRVANYVQRQMQHHAKLSFQEEYIGLLEKHEIDFDPRYVWD